MGFFSKKNKKETEQRKADGTFLIVQNQALEGDPKAMYVLGSLYIEGQKTEKDPEKAIYWLEKAVSAGWETAALVLGQELISGKNLPQNADRGIYWYQKGVEMGNADCAFWLCYEYAVAENIPFDSEKAIYWGQKSVAMGQPKAQELLDALNANS